MSEQKLHCMGCSAEFFLDKGEDTCPYCDSKMIDKFWDDSDEEYSSDE